jgi:DNA-binding transcriptional LysR family regulator
MDLDDRASRRLKMSDLRMLTAVVRWGSMSKAASHLNLTQSAISKALGALEHTLNVRLLDRTPHGVQPTIYGQALLDRGTAIFDELAHAVKDIEFLADPAGGELRIGSGPPLAGMLTETIERLASRYPKMIFHVIERDVTVLMNNDLLERGIDLVLGRIANPIDDEVFSADVLFDDNVSIVAGKASTWARKRKIELSELVHERWILPPLAGLAGAHATDAFRANGLDVPQVRVIANSTSVRDRLLSTGRYLAAVPGVELRFSDTRTQIKVLPVHLRVKPRPVGIVTLKNRTLGPAARLFVEEARVVAKRMTARN